MSRLLRLEYPGAVYHITSRGNERKSIFKSDADAPAFPPFSPCPPKVCIRFLNQSNVSNAGRRRRQLNSFSNGKISSESWRIYPCGRLNIRKINPQMPEPHLLISIFWKANNEPVPIDIPYLGVASQADCFRFTPTCVGTISILIKSGNL